MARGRPNERHSQLSWNDARNDPDDTKTDIFFSRSIDGGQTFSGNVRVTTAMTDESAANPNADAGNQYGDYQRIAAFGGVARPMWTDGRLDGKVDLGSSSAKKCSRPPSGEPWVDRPAQLAPPGAAARSAASAAGCEGKGCTVSQLNATATACVSDFSTGSRLH